jgi:hypothetical protein
MTTLTLLLLTALAADTPEGTICGVVLGAEDGRPVPDAEVVLRGKVEGQYAVLEETKADARGQFAFRQLPIGDGYEYLPGANRDGIHYPGPRVILREASKSANVSLVVRKAITEPNPLGVLEHEVDVRSEPGLVRVTERMLIDNPTQSCYVGRAPQGKGDPVTLKLSIPRDFQQVTFAGEFYGRRFAIVDNNLVTSIPWTPGRRELKFSYVLANPNRQFHWERTMDLPCRRLKVAVHTDKPEEVACSLASPSAGERDAVTFEVADRELPVGEVVQLTMGRLPVPWIVYARWIAVGVLAIGGIGVGAVMRRKAATGGRAPTSQTGSNLRRATTGRGFMG